MSAINLEEAANVASEFVSSLENLPIEVQHLLLEIKHKDKRSQELQQEINKESAKYIRHSLRSASSNPPGQALSVKDTTIPQTVKVNYAEIDRLAVEKEKLAERIVSLLTRARARLDLDLNKVLVLQGDIDPAIQVVHASVSGTRSSGPIAQVTESLRVATNAIAIPEAPSVPVATTPAGPPPMKKRRVAATQAASSAGSIKLPSPAPLPTASAHTASGAQRSRLSQQVARHSPMRQRRVTASVDPDADEDAEGEEDLEDNAEDNGDVEDKSLYCFCQKLSYGEMIACDNPDCNYQWFHLPCVNLKPPLPDNWYCSECVTKVEGAAALLAQAQAATERQTSQRKGRKKQ